MIVITTLSLSTETSWTRVWTYPRRHPASTTGRFVRGNKDTNTGERNFLIGQDLETVAHAGFTGEDFDGGRAFLLDVKHCGDGTDLPSRCHIMLVHETAMSITESGVMVSM